MLNKALPNLPAGSDIWKAISQAITSISKLAPPSGQTPGVQRTQLQSLMQNAGRNAMLQQVMGSLGAGGAQQPGAGAAPASGPAPSMLGG